MVRFDILRIDIFQAGPTHLEASLVVNGLNVLVLHGHLFCDLILKGLLSHFLNQLVLKLLRHFSS